LIRGERVVDVIQDALEAKEAAKEAKKVCSFDQVKVFKLTYSAQDKDLDLPRPSKPLQPLAPGHQQL
jgi:hypothetical protein